MKQRVLSIIPPLLFSVCVTLVYAESVYPTCGIYTQEETTCQEYLHRSFHLPS